MGKDAVTEILLQGYATLDIYLSFHLHLIDHKINEYNFL